MATLAQDLQNRGIRLEDPYQEHKETITSFENRVEGTTKNPPPATEEEEDEDYSYEEEEDDVLGDYFVEEEEEEEEEEVLDQETSLAMVKSPKRKVRKSATDALSSQMASLKMEPLQAITGDLSCPLLSGRWETFDHESDTTDAYILMRMVIIDGVKDDSDFELSFRDKRTFRIRMKWPKYMQKCMMMTTLDIGIDEEGNSFQAFPAGHQVYTDMGKTAKGLKDESGCIWSEGLFSFKNDMEMTKFEPQIFQIPDGGGTILQVKFTEKPEDTGVTMPFGSPIVVKQAGDAMSKSLGKRNQYRAAATEAARAEAARVQAARVQAMRLAAEKDRMRRAAEANAAKAISEAKKAKDAAKALALAAAATEGGESEPSPKRNKTTHIALAPAALQNFKQPFAKQFLERAKGLMNNGNRPQYEAESESDDEDL